MLQKNEFVMFILAIAALIFIIGNRLRLEKISAYKILIAGFLSFFTGWFFAVLEGFFWGNFLNLMEHICYTAGSVFTALWCCKICDKKGVKK